MTSYSSRIPTPPIQEVCPKGGEVRPLLPSQVAVILGARPGLEHCHEAAFRCPLHGVVFSAVDDKRADLLLAKDVPIATPDTVEKTLEFAAQIIAFDADSLTPEQIAPITQI